MWLTGPVAPRHVGSSQTRARTRVPCIGRQTLNHCATREALSQIFEALFGTAKPHGGAMGTGLGRGGEEETKTVALVLVWDIALGPLGVASLWPDN